MNDLISTTALFFLNQGMKIITIVIISLLVYLFLDGVLKKIISGMIKKSSRQKRVKTIKRVFFGTAKFVLVIVAILMILSELGLDIAPILASVGLLGLAISMGSREIVGDFLAGLFILIDDLYEIGDEVKILGMEGKIKDVDLRKTIIEAPDGVIYIIPNGRIKEITKK